MNKSELMEYVEVCGWALARAHARTGDSAQIGGYLGKSGAFDGPMQKFAMAYADQTERDHETLVKAVRAGPAARCSGMIRERKLQIQRQRIFAGDQARGAVEGEVKPGPLQHHQQPILKLHDVEQGG